MVESETESETEPWDLGWRGRHGADVVTLCWHGCWLLIRKVNGEGGFLRRDIPYFYREWVKFRRVTRALVPRMNEQVVAISGDWKERMGKRVSGG